MPKEGCDLNTEGCKLLHLVNLYEKIDPGFKYLEKVGELRAGEFDEFMEQILETFPWGKTVALGAEKITVRELGGRLFSAASMALFLKGVEEEDKMN